MGETISIAQLVVLGSITALIITIFGGFIIKLLQGNFDKYAQGQEKLERGQKELREYLDEHMVGRAMCTERHKALEREQMTIQKDVADHAKHIKHVFKLINGEVLVKGFIETEEREDGD